MDPDLDYFPAFLRLHGKSCLLVGGGAIAARKAQLLLAAGARLTVVAPAIGTAMAEITTRRDVCCIQREFRKSDVSGHWLVVCATDDVELQRVVYAAAEKAGVFCNSVDATEHSSYITPAIVDRSPVIVAISSGGSAPVLARKIRAQIESLLPAALGRLAEFAGAWRARVSKQLRDIPRRRRFWEAFFDGRVASAVYARQPAAAHRAIAALLSAASGQDKAQGEAWLVGAGPGDPGLLTLRALQIMQSADVIVHDRLVSADILSLARRDAERISVGKKPGCRNMSQEEINAMLVALVAAGKRVCRLKGGDPFIFGRGGEEAEALAAADLPCQIVPGITAAAGCAAYSGIPLTHREAAQSVVLLTAHGKNSVDQLDWPSLARDRQTLAVYMAVSRFPQLMRELIVHGRPAHTPIAIIEKGTTPEQRIIRGSLGQLTMLAAANRIEAPAMLFIGEVARLGSDNASRARDSLAIDAIDAIEAIEAESAILKTANIS